MKQIIVFFILFTGSISAQTKYQKDFLEFWTDCNDNYAYFNEQNIDWIKVKEIYQPVADTIKNDDDFIRLLETVINEFHNGHISLNTNLDSSNRIIPTGADLFVEKKADAYVITDLRENFPAILCGLKIGMTIIKFNGKNIEEQLLKFLPKYTNNHNNNMFQYALNMLFAGTHNKPREITTIENGMEKTFFPDTCKSNDPKTTLIEHSILKNNIGYIRINNSLGNNDLIKEFDSILDKLLNTNGLILDLTATPSGGNTAVARAIIGRFIEKESAYQKHILEETDFNIIRSWTEFVLPRNTIYKKKLVVIVGHWTGSMGEGMAIAFDGMKRGTIVGTKMARLIGAIEGFQLSETKINYQIPTERLYHINGTPREDFIPKYLSENLTETWAITEKLLKTKR